MFFIKSLIQLPLEAKTIHYCSIYMNNLIKVFNDFTLSRICMHSVDIRLFNLEFIPFAKISILANVLDTKHKYIQMKL